ASLLQEPPVAPRPLAVVPVTDAEQDAALELAFQARHEGYTTELCYGNNMGKRMKHANKVAARLALIVGPDELANGQVLVKDLDSGEQQVVDMANLAEYLTTVQFLYRS
ncbi:MAG: His/Gly/Thr/Pro-type tRNA ligase C-terminal domain-containing protein, partial [Alphaproteobacteria bacterium]